jgi:hypothetical protein
VISKSLTRLGHSCPEVTHPQEALLPRTAPDVQTWLAAHDSLRIVPLVEPVIERVGQEPRSLYAETYWLPVIGPSAMWALRRLAAWAEAKPAGVDIALPDLAHELGLGGGTQRNSPMVYTLARLVVFQLARIDESQEALAVLRAVPPLARQTSSAAPAPPPCRPAPGGARDGSGAMTAAHEIARGSRPGRGSPAGAPASPDVHAGQSVVTGDQTEQSARTIVVTGARGGQGTTTVAAALALRAATHGSVVLVAAPDQQAAALLGVPAIDHGEIVQVTRGLTLAAEPHVIGGADTVVVDGGLLGADAVLPPTSPTSF